MGPEWHTLLVVLVLGYGSSPTNPSHVQTIVEHRITKTSCEERLRNYQELAVIGPNVVKVVGKCKKVE